MLRPVKACTLLIAIAALVTTGVLESGASGHGPATTVTLNELAEGSTFTHIRNTKTRSSRANSQGDLLAFTNPLADSSGARVGTLSASCTTTSGARRFQRSTLTCLAVIALRDGTLTVQGNTSPGKRTTTGAVTGGTGAYANASGVLVSKQNPSGAVDTITLQER
jgi:hypothetical protein